MRMTMEKVKNWLKNSEMDEKSIETFTSIMANAEIIYEEFAEDCVVLRHPKLGTWVVTKYGAVFCAPPDIESPFEYKDKITLFSNECTEFTFDMRTGKLIEVHQS
jgi:hypothetical protein